MAKKHLRLLSAALAVTMAVGTVGGTVSASAAQVTEETSEATLASYYSTNGTGYGKEASITVDGDISDWDSSMLVAQGTANDDPRVYRPNSMYELPIDLYALYAAWDDDNLYLMWEMTNVQDIVAPSDDYPLSQGILYQTMNVPFFIAIDTGMSDTIGNDGATSTGSTIWDSGITISEDFNRLIAVSTNGANGPYVYSGDSSGLNTTEIYTATTSGIEFDYDLGILSSTVYGLDGAYGETSSTNPRYVGDMCDEDGDWVEFNSMGHSTSTMDFHYEMSIPLSTLGMTSSDLESNGVGVLLIATMGKSGMDCLPYDLSMNDNADLDDSAGSQENNSFEKSDEDYVTTSFARVVTAGSGSSSSTSTDTSSATTTDSTVDSTTDSTTDTTTDSDIDASTETSSDTISDSGIPISSSSTVEVTASAGDTVTVSVNLSGVTNLQGFTSELPYSSSLLKYVTGSTSISGASFVANDTGSSVKWNILCDTSGVTLSSATEVATFTFTALADMSAQTLTNTISSMFNTDMVYISPGAHTLTVSVESSENDTDTSANTTTDSDTATESESESNTDTATAEDSESTTSTSTVQITATMSSTVTVTIDLSNVTDLAEVLASFEYDSSLLEFVGGESLIDGAELVTDDTGDSIWWSLTSSSGITLSSSTSAITLTFKAISNVSDETCTNTITSMTSTTGESITANQTVTADAAEDTDSEWKDVYFSASEGDTVTVTIVGKNVDDAVGMQARVRYDTALLSFESFTSCVNSTQYYEVGSNVITMSSPMMNSLTEGFDCSDETDIFILTFTTQSDISSSTLALEYKIDEFYDLDLNEYDHDSTTDCKVTVTSSATSSSDTSTDSDNSAVKVPVVASEGDTVTVTVYVQDADAALGLDTRLYYDSTALEYVGVDYAYGTQTLYNDISDPLVLLTLFDASGEDFTDRTDIFVLTFTALTDITSTDDVLSYLVNEFYDVNLDDYDYYSTVYCVAQVLDSDTDSDEESDSNSATDSDSSADTSNDTESDSDTTASSDSDTNNNGGTDGDTSSDTSSGTDGDTDTPVDSDSGTDTDNNNASSDTDNGSSTNSDTDSNTNTGTDTDASRDTDASTDTSIDVSTDTDANNNNNNNNNNSDNDTSTDSDTGSTTTQSVLIGDANLDGKINSVDALLVLRYSAGLASLSSIQVFVSEVNGDGKINSVDALAILRYSAALATTTNVGNYANYTE